MSAVGTLEPRPSANFTKQGKYLGFQGVEIGDRTYEYFSRVNNRKDGKRPYDDTVLMTPVYEDDGEKRVLFQAQLRPALIFKPVKEGKNPFIRAISIEIPGGLATDKEAAKDLETTARNEFQEEVGLDIKKITERTHGISSSSGSTDETGRLYVVECEKANGNLKPTNPDMNHIATFSVPLKNAYKFLKDVLEAGFSVCSASFIGVVEAMHQFDIQADLKSSVKARCHWQANESSPKSDYIKFFYQIYKSLEKDFRSLIEAKK